MGETVETEEKVPTPAEKETPAPEKPAEPNPVEALAQKLGWKPDFEGEAAVDAETFILRSRDINSNLSKTVHSLRRELSAVKEGVEVVKWTADQASKREIGRLKSEIRNLKEQRREAITTGNADAVDQYDGQIRDLEAATKEVAPPKTEVTPPPPQEFVEWEADNGWYNTDTEMNRYANALLELPEYIAVGKASYPRLLKKVTTAVKKEFPDKFPAPTKTVPAAGDPSPVPTVTPSHRRSKPPKTKASAADLSYDQRRVGTDFVAQGIFKDLDEYAESLQKSVEGGKR